MTDSLLPKTMGPRRLAFPCLAGLLLAVAAGACGSDATTSGPSATSSSVSSTSAGGSGGAGGSTASTGTGGSSSQAGGAGGTGGSGGGGIGPAIQLKPKLLESGTSAGRIAVVWFQFSDDVDSVTPQLAYDAPFDPMQPTTWIEVEKIAAPDEALLLCKRDCADATVCKCTSDEAVGTGIILVAPDTNMDQKLELAELMNAYGRGATVVGYSKKTYPVGSLLDQYFTEGVLQGVLPYAIIEKPMGFDKLGKPDLDQVYELALCSFPKTMSCALPNYNF